MDLDFGIFILMQQRDQRKSAAQIIQEAVEQTQMADRSGFAAAWYAEHHFSNYGLCPSPLMVAAHCAGVTQQIRLGSAVVVAPLYTPARLIAEIALADQLSKGRLNVGIGGGYQQFEFERFGMSLQNAKEKTLEMLDMIELGLTQKKFSYDGAHYQQPMTAINVRAVQQPLPPVWIASGDPMLMRRALRSDYHVFISGGLGGTKRLGGFRGVIDDLCVAEGKDPAKAKVAMLRFAYASDNKAEVEHYVDCARYQQRIAVSLKTRSESVEDDYLVTEKPYDEELPFEKLMKNLPVGSVDTVIERLLGDIRAVRPVHVALQTQVGDFDHGLMLKQLQLWNKVIIPTIQQELARDKAAAVSTTAEAAS
ncbi:LLM class flavin-dependent oxidoreductase [Bordetella genomosp. 4]|uniref:LLM class flavin-dependent oxidoreductase n=1 Tax=Bordetella genomosp. 4 TaxID=463044 RepID=UPI0020CD630B|nr:LLM class flavin-dependent oxidoreductase [Bordetella genomosp. 4]